MNLPLFTCYNSWPPYVLNFNRYIIQWNVNGLKTRLHLGEIQRLLKNFEPTAICLQHANNPVPSIGKYFLATSSCQEEGNLGTAIYIHQKVFYDKIQVNSDEFQISAIRLQLENQKIILCNIYNQPNKNYDLRHLHIILDHFNEPILILGDFNAHSPIWDCNCIRSDIAGTYIEQLMDSNNLCCLNDNESNTYFSKTHGTMSSVHLI